jgi:hypothetical protein
MEEKLKHPKEYYGMVYMNHNISTYPMERSYIYNLLKDECYITTEHGYNGVGFDGYLNNIYNHKYVICPRGNGLDTHRLWEALYMGTFPIVKKDINNSFYSDMPILFVNDWTEITLDLLIEMCSVLEYRKDTFDKSKLTFGYWENKIICSGK